MNKKEEVLVSFILDYQHYVVRFPNKWVRIAAVVTLIENYYQEIEDDCYKWLDENAN